jgi:hypothetical protein
VPVQPPHSPLTHPIQTMMEVRIFIAAGAGAGKAVRNITVGGCGVG